MISIDHTSYIAEFEDVIGSNVNKKILVDILQSRLNGSFEPDCIVIDKTIVSFNFEKNLTEEQKYYLDVFDEYYYTKPLINDLIYFNQIVNPIVLKIEENYKNAINFMKVKPDNLKQSVLFISKFGDNQFELNVLFEYTLILSKLNELDKIIVNHFHSILEPDFSVKKIINMDKHIGFHEFYYDVKSHISNIYGNKINCLLASNINEETKQQIEIMSSMILKLKKVMNALFWIVYANEFKFIDNIQNKNLILDEYLEDYEKKLSEWFNYKDETICEYGGVHVNERNMVEEFMECIEKLDNKSLDILKQKAVELYSSNLKDEEVEKILTEELDKYVDTLTKDKEEKEFYKYMFRENTLQFPAN